MPRPPEGSDLLQKRLFEDCYCVLYDASQSAPPDTVQAYLAAQHATVVHEPRRRLDIDEVLSARGIERPLVVQVPGFAGVGPFHRGTAMIATLPSLLRNAFAARLRLRRPARRVQALAAPARHDAPAARARPPSRV
jgi:hypothetical protein